MAGLTHNDLPQAVEKILEIVQFMSDCMMKNFENKNNEESKDRWFDTKELIEYLPTHPSLSDIYSKTHKRTMPFHKSGKRIIFLKSEIDAWLLSNQSKTIKQMTEDAQNIMIQKHNSRGKNK